MAVQGKGFDGGMKDQTSFDARSGKAKHPQTSFAVHPGMKDQTSGSYGPANPGSGPDASSPQPLDLLSPADRGKTLRKQPSPLKASWDMKDADGKGVDPAIAGKVIGEAIVGGSHLPGSVAKPGPLPKR